MYTTLHASPVSLIEVRALMQAISHQGSGSGRARRDAAARAMQGWHSQRLLESGDVTEPIVKVSIQILLTLYDLLCAMMLFVLLFQDKGLGSTTKQKNLKNIGNYS